MLLLDGYESRDYYLNTYYCSIDFIYLSKILIVYIEIFCIKYLFYWLRLFNNLNNIFLFVVMNHEIIIFTPIFAVLIGSIVFTILKKRKRSAESIYKLIDDLEKKYIY